MYSEENMRQNIKSQATPELNAVREQFIMVSRVVVDWAQKDWAGPSG